jgi:hypothetical protein
VLCGVRNVARLDGTVRCGGVRGARGARACVARLGGVQAGALVREWSELLWRAGWRAFGETLRCYCRSSLITRAARVLVFLLLAALASLGLELRPSVARLWWGGCAACLGDGASGTGGGLTAYTVRWCPGARGEAREHEPGRCAGRFCLRGRSYCSVCEGGAPFMGGCGALAT